MQYALTVCTNIYVSCIKQFLSSVLIKKTNDVVRLQALIDRNKVIKIEDTVRQALRLDDAESVNCLLNEEIFIDLARMGNAKRTALNEFSSFMASAVICLAIGKGFSGVETSLFEEMLVTQQVADDVADVVIDDVAADDGEGIIAKIDADKDVILEEVDAAKDAEVEKNDDEPELVELKEVIDVVTITKLITEVVTTAATTVASTINAASSAARRRKGVVIRDPKETAIPTTIVHSEPKSKDKGKGILVEEPKPLKK
nr:hypothetical protein [Tanacetum cinerariifolium]